MMNSTYLPIIAALDEISPEKIPTFLDREIPEIQIIKIGLEVFNLTGKDFLAIIEKTSKKEYFLDLKLHDIPNTVFNAIKSLEGLSPKFLTIHLTGGKEMINRALEARNKFLPSTKIIGVSYLTSLSDQNFDELWGTNKMTLLKKVTKIAKDTNIDGIVCSAEDIETIKPNLQGNQIIITPGIRTVGSDLGDQKRVTTPEDALKRGSDYLVIGRPLREPTTKKEVIQQVRDFYLSQ